MWHQPPRHCQHRSPAPTGQHHTTYSTDVNCMSHCIRTWPRNPMNLNENNSTQIKWSLISHLCRLTTLFLLGLGTVSFDEMCIRWFCPCPVVTCKVKFQSENCLSTVLIKSHQSSVIKPVYIINDISCS